MVSEVLNNTGSGLKMTTVVVIKQLLPSYIKEFLGEERECLLVYNKTPTKSSSSAEEFNKECSYISKLNDSNPGNVSMQSELDLTGNPLDIDLDLNVTVDGFPNETISQTPPSWTISESSHFPISLKEARNLLNTKFNCKKSDIPTFCVTDGSDNQKTVFVGGHNSDIAITTYLAHIMGLYSHTDDQISLENFKKEHDKYVRVTADSTTYNFRSLYNIHGFSLQEIPALEYSKCNGCLFLETSWNTFSKEEPNIMETRMKMILKVVSGHKNSSIRFLWDQLVNLRRYLEILTNQEAVNDGNTVISYDYLTISDLTDNLHTLCNGNLKKKRKIDSEFLDLNDLKDETILDRLWFLLNRCQNLKDLKIFFCMFFRAAKLENFDHRDSVLIDILRNCSDSSTYIAKLTFSESLKLLVHIGLEKLKQNYLTITNFYYPIHQALLEKTWSDFRVKDQQKARRVTGIVKNHGITDTTFNEKKMEFLLKLHDTAEILVFLKHDVKTSSELSSDNFSFICKHVYQKYIFNKSEKPQESGLKVKLLNISCNLNSRNNEVYKDKLPVTRIYEITSKVHTSKIKTVFHVSDHPIFPKCIYDNYGASDRSLIDGDEELRHMLYVSKLVVLN